MISNWINAFRLRTLPLSFSSVIAGSAIAYKPGDFSWTISLLILLTVLFLQILSNLANDYGDGKKGTDNAQRIGPERTVQGGHISLRAMKNAIIIFAILSLCSGSLLIWTSLGINLLIESLVFFFLGLAAIASAIYYTIGKKAYGYRGLGDIFVFLFFGLLGVMGTYYLITHSFQTTIILPAVAMGLFATGVLNVNNMRDIENDLQNKKITIAGLLGVKKAKWYHLALILTGWVLTIIFVTIDYANPVNYLFLFAFPLFAIHLNRVRHIENPVDFDPELKKLSLSIFLFSILFGIGISL
jgi:1,4-dihydroxy-2-naphthoate polyprenyltransferase